MRRKYKWPITASKEINASRNVVWEKISKIENLNDSHPFCEKNSSIEWSGEDSIDTIKYYNGRILIRKFFEWSEGQGYKLMIGREGGRQTEVHWDIIDNSKNTCDLKITLYMPHLQHIPVFIRWIPHLLVIKPKMKKYLKSVVNGFEYNIRTGKPVERNQFGSHPWFSPELDDD